jgi:uncharacterized protein (DUF488 family)
MEERSNWSPVFTIGHSNHEIERFLLLLRTHDVSAVADVRSVPFSRAQPQFNRGEISRALKENGIKYVFLGRELGARSNDDSCYEGGRVRYQRLARSDLFRSGLRRVQQGSQQHRVALMCAERDPLTCHRSLLVARELEYSGTPVLHIHANGHLEAHPAAMLRLVDLLGLSAGDLFCSEGDLVTKAYDLQEQRVAYVRAKPATKPNEVLS